MDLYTFPITSETEVEPLQLRSKNLSLGNLKVPSGNSMGSKNCALAINSIFNLYFTAYNCFQQKNISPFCFVGPSKQFPPTLIISENLTENGIEIKIYSVLFCLKTYPQCNDQTEQTQMG